MALKRLKKCEETRPVMADRLLKMGRSMLRPYNGGKAAASREIIASGQYEEMRWTRVRRETPVGPFASQGLASSFHAVPAMSR